MDNQVNPKTGTLRLRGLFPNKNEALAPGYFGRFNMFDDWRQIRNDKTITDFTWPHVKTMLFENYRGTGQELMYFSFAVNWLAAGPHASMHRWQSAHI